MSSIWYSAHTYLSNIAATFFRRADVAIWTVYTGRAGLEITIGGNPGYQHLYSLILHIEAVVKAAGGDIDCNLKREIYGFYSLNGCLPGA